MSRLLLASLLLLAVPVTAQECDTCTVPLDMDPDDGLTFGLPGETTWSAEGGAITFDVFNWFDVAHTIAIDGTTISFEAAPLGSQHGPFELADGTYTLRDVDSGDTATLTVGEDLSKSSPGNDVPGLGFVAFAAVLGGLLFVRRH